MADKKLIPKHQSPWQPIVLQNDNTSILRPMIILPIKRDFIAEALRKHSAEAISLDNRTSDLRKRDNKEADYKHKQYQKAKDDLKRAEGFENLMKLASPSTYAEAITGLQLTSAGKLAFDVGVFGLAGGAKSLLTRGLNAFKFIWNNGKLILKDIPRKAENFYRAVNKDAINDAKKYGIIRGRESRVGDNYPFFGRSSEPYHDTKYVIEGTPESADWISTYKYVYNKNPEIVRLPKIPDRDYSKAYDTIIGSPESNGFLRIGAFDNEFLEGYEALPMTNGQLNVSPSSNFTYWKKHPIIGWRKYNFKQGGKMNIINQFKSGGQIRKMLTASGGPIHYSRTMTTDNLSKAANYVGNYILKGLGAFGKIMAAPLTGGPLGPATVVLPKTKKLLDAERRITETQELLIGKASTWLSPLNYGAALVTGNGLNARKGEEEVASWSPAWQAVGRLGELYAGPKVIKGVKSAPRVVINTAAKAGVKPAKAAVVAREIKLATKNKPNVEVPKPIIRTKVGDIEIDNPQLFYRQGSAEMGTDFIKSGVVRTSGGFENPMFTEGALFKKVPTRTKEGLSKGDKIALEGPYNKTKSDLLVTDSSVDMIPADQGSGKNYTWFEDYMLDPFAEESIFDKSRVPLFNGTATSANTTAYRWEPGYGYRLVVEEPSTSLKFFERKPARISEAEKAGIPKGERNVKQGYLLKDAIEEANKFAEKWGYDKLSQNATLLDIENLYNQHNTFFRGVTTEQLENTRDRVAKELGINPEQLTNDLYLLYVSTHPWPGNDRIWVTPFSHYGKIYGNTDMIGGKGLLSAVMRPWKTTKDIKQWPKLSLWTLGFKEDISNPVITPWVSNAPDAIRSLGAQSELLVKSPLIYRGLGKDFKGTFLLYLKYKDGQGKLGWIESLVGELPLEIIIEKQPKINLTKTDEVVQEYVNDKSITGPPVVSDGNSRMIWRKNRWSKEGTGIMNAKFRPNEPTNPHHITLSPDFNMESIPEKTYFWGTTLLPFKGVLGKGLGLDISTALIPNLLYNAFRSLHWMEPKVQELGLLYLETGNLKPIIEYYKQANPIEKGQLSSIVRQPMFLNSDIPYRFYNDYEVVMKENPILQKEINNMTPLDRNMFKHSLGWASTADNGLPVIFNKEPGFSGTKVIGHEGNHAFLFRFEQPLNMQALLERALPAEETKIVNGKEVRLTGNDKKGLGSAHINKERGSTIHDARSLIINSYYKQNGKYPSYTLLNLLIDKMTEEQLRLAIRTTGAYGREYAPLIKDFEALRECLKYAYKIGGKINIQV